MPSQLDLYNTKLFKEVWVDTTEEEVTTTAKAHFMADFKATSLYDSTNFVDAAINRTYDLLFAKYANSPISGFTESQWKLRVFSVMYQYLPNWNKRVTLQQTLRGLTANELREGSRGIYNTATGDATSGISTTDTKETAFINNQSVTLNTKDPLRAYDELVGLLDDTVTSDYLNKFNDLFLKVVLPQKPIYYEYEEEV